MRTPTGRLSSGHLMDLQLGNAHAGCSRLPCLPHTNLTVCCFQLLVSFMGVCFLSKQIFVALLAAESKCWWPLCSYCPICLRLLSDRSYRICATVFFFTHDHVANPHPEGPTASEIAQAHGPKEASMQSTIHSLLASSFFSSKLAGFAQLGVGAAKAMEFAQLGLSAAKAMTCNSVVFPRAPSKHDYVMSASGFAACYLSRPQANVVVSSPRV